MAERGGCVNRRLDAQALGPHVDRLTARIGSVPPHAMAAAKAKAKGNVLCAELHGGAPAAQ